METYVEALIQFVLTHKWWFIASAPIVIVVFVLKALSPN